MSAKKMPTMGLGIAGIGGGATAMLPAFLRHPNIKIAAGADIDADVLTRFASDFQCKSYDNIEAMCSNSEVDIVYIATPNHFHTEHAVTALEHKKHVLLEKPMTLTIEEADTIIAAADRNNVALAVNVKHSFEPRIQKIRSFVQNGELGNLRMLHNWYYNDWIYRPRTEEELNPKLGGGVVWRQGPHQIDIFRTIAGGMVRSVRAMVGTWDDERPVPGCYVAYLEFESGAVAVGVYDGYDHFHSTELVHADHEPKREYGRARSALTAGGGAASELEAKRSARYGGASQVQGAKRTPAQIKNAMWVLGGPMLVNFDRGDLRLTPDGLSVYGHDRKHDIEFPIDRDGRDGVIDELYNAILANKQPFNNGRWGKATVEVLLAIHSSAAERHDVLLSHQVEASDLTINAHK